MAAKIVKIFKPFYTRNFPELFAEINDPWGYSTSGFEKERFNIIIQLAQSVPHKNILEIGCAEGHLTEKLAKITHNMSAIEISADAIARAKQKTSGVNFINSDFEKYQPKNKKYDLVVLSEVLYYFKNKDAVIKNIKKSGRYLIVSNAGIWHPILKKYFKDFYLLKTTLHIKPIEFKITTIALYKL